MNKLSSTLLFPEIDTMPIAQMCIFFNSIIGEREIQTMDLMVFSTLGCQLSYVRFRVVILKIHEQHILNKIGKYFQTVARVEHLA